jgi:ppGpp synthetase/RelA/SpoT-type nucleotidyltranferase
MKGMASERVAAKEVARLLLGLKTSLKERGVKPENMRVQLESELLASLDIPPKKLVQWADQKLGLKLILLDWREKARQAYVGCVGAMSVKAQTAKHMVVSIEDLQTTFVFGQGLSWERDLTNRFAMGFDQVFLENPLDVIDVALARNEVAQKLNALLSSEVKDIVPGRSVHLTWHATDADLFELENKRRPGGLGLQRIGMDGVLMHWYLSQPGLQFLKQQILSDELKLNQARLLLKRLVIMAELAKRLDISAFQFGPENGATRAVFDELARGQIIRRAQIFGGLLAAQAQAQYAKLEEALRKIFPVQQFRGRIKSRTSITDKLTRKALRTEPPIFPMRNIQEASMLVSDGVGFCLILDDQRGIEQVCDALVYALRNEQIQILELKNYRGIGTEALPYLSGMDIHRLQRSIQVQNDHPPMSVQDDEHAVKASGYTTAQFVLRLKNPETRAFDLPPCELQIRGAKVDALYAIEHCIRDVRLGKRDVLQENDLTKERIALFDAALQLNDAQYEMLLAYFNAYYGHCRRLENRLSAMTPPMPKGLAPVFDLEKLLTLETPAESPEREKLPTP